MTTTGNESKRAQAITDHYNRLAPTFDASFKYWNHGTVDAVVKFVQINPSDVVADIGSATGEIAHLIWKQKQLKQPIVCVEPSRELVEISKFKDGVKPVHSSVEDFITSFKDNTRPFDKFLVCNCIHHFSDPVSVLKGLFDRLAKDGACVILHTMSFSCMFKAADDCFTQNQLKAKDQIVESMKMLNMKWTENVDEYCNSTMPKSEWYATLRNRFVSYMERFSDEEIEAGIEEIEKETAGQDTIELKVEMVVWVVTKD